MICQGKVTLRKVGENCSAGTGGYTKFGVNGCVYELPLSQYAFESGAFEDGAFESTGEILCPST